MRVWHVMRAVSHVPFKFRSRAGLRFGDGGLNDVYGLRHLGRLRQKDTLHTSRLPFEMPRIKPEIPEPIYTVYYLGMNLGRVIGRSGLG